MNLEQVVQMINSNEFYSIMERDSSKKIFSKIKEYVSQFYGARQAENREKDFIVALTSMVEMLKISDEEKQRYFDMYDKIARKYELPGIDYALVKSKII